MGGGRYENDAIRPRVISRNDVLIETHLKFKTKIKHRVRGPNEVFRATNIARHTNGSRICRTVMGARWTGRTRNVFRYRNECCDRSRISVIIVCLRLKVYTCVFPGLFRYNEDVRRSFFWAWRSFGSGSPEYTVATTEGERYIITEFERRPMFFFRVLEEQRL